VPAEVPGSAGIDASPGTLTVSDAGAIAVSYEDASGGGRAGALTVRANADGMYVLELLGDGLGAPSRHCADPYWAPRVTGHGRSRRVLVKAACGVACRISGTVRVAGRRWHARRALRSRSARAGKAVRLVRTFQVPRRARGRSLRLTVRLVADDRHGNRAVRSARARVRR
jgi:hypothetical protein